MNILKAPLTIALMLAPTAIPAQLAPAAQPGDPVLGHWANPRGTLAVETAPCRDDGGSLCGAIIWASDTAMADAREAGVPRLVGTQLLSGYHRIGQNSWSGTVYIPDMGRSFSSRISQNSPRELKISGCLVGGFLCKSQTWHRVA